MHNRRLEKRTFSDKQICSDTRDKHENTRQNPIHNEIISYFESPRAAANITTADINRTAYTFNVCFSNNFGANTDSAIVISIDRGSDIIAVDILTFSPSALTENTKPAVKAPLKELNHSIYSSWYSSNHDKIMEESAIPIW